MDHAKIPHYVKSAMQDARGVLRLFEERGTEFTQNGDYYQLYHMQIKSPWLQKWTEEVFIDHEEIILPSVCLCEDRETEERHYHVLVYSSLRDRYYWEIRNIMGIPRDSVRRALIGSKLHGFNSILYLLKKYGSGKALPNSGRFGRKVCTRKWRSRTFHDLHSRPLTNDEHSYVVSRMRQEFPLLAQPNQEQILAVERLQSISAKCHQSRKRSARDNFEERTHSSPVPPRKMVKTYRDLGTSRDRKDSTCKCDKATTSKDLHGCGGSGDLGFDSDDEWCRKAIALGLGRSDTTTNGNDNDGSDTTLDDTECVDKQSVRDKEAIPAKQRITYL